MALSFSLIPQIPPADGKKRRVLVTGAAGRIGATFAKEYHERYDLRLMVRRMNEKAEALKSFGEVVLANLDDPAALRKACQNIDTVIHLAGEPDPSAVWDDLLPANIIGTYQVLTAAKAAGCRRVVYASSIHAVSGYLEDMQVKTSDPVNPGDLYGVSKCFGEALGRYMAEQENLSFIGLRIGAFQPMKTARADDVYFMDAFLSHRDMGQMLCRCIDDERLRFALFHVLSNNRFKRLDITDARELVGFAPKDDFTSEHPELKHLDLDEKVSTHNLRDPQQKSGLREDV